MSDSDILFCYYLLYGIYLAFIQVTLLEQKKLMTKEQEMIPHVIL